MKWPWGPREAPVDRETRDRLSNVLADVTRHLLVVVDDLERTADRKLPDDS